MSKKYYNATLSELANASVAHKRDKENVHYNLNDLELEVDGRKCIAHEVSMCHRDLLFFTDQGTVSYGVNNYGGGWTPLLIDWEFDYE